MQGEWSNSLHCQLVCNSNIAIMLISSVLGMPSSTSKRPTAGSLVQIGALGAASSHFLPLRNANSNWKHSSATMFICLIINNIVLQNDTLVDRGWPFFLAISFEMAVQYGRGAIQRISWGNHL